MLTPYVVIATTPKGSAFVRIEHESEESIRVSVGKDPSVFWTDREDLVDDLVSRIQRECPPFVILETFECQFPFPSPPFNEIDMLILNNDGSFPDSATKGMLS